MTDKQRLNDLIDKIKEQTEYDTQKKISIYAGWEEDTLAELKSKNHNLDEVIVHLQKLFPNILNNSIDGNAPDRQIDSAIHPDAMRLVAEKVLIIQAWQNTQKSMFEKIFAKLMEMDIREVEAITDKVFDLELSKLKNELQQGKK